MKTLKTLFAVMVVGTYTWAGNYIGPQMAERLGYTSDYLKSRNVTVDTKLVNEWFFPDEGELWYLACPDEMKHEVKCFLSLAQKADGWNLAAFDEVDRDTTLTVSEVDRDTTLTVSGATLSSVPVDDESNDPLVIEMSSHERIAKLIALSKAMDSVKSGMTEVAADRLVSKYYSNWWNEPALIGTTLYKNQFYCVEKTGFRIQFRMQSSGWVVSYVLNANEDCAEWFHYFQYGTR